MLFRSLVKSLTGEEIARVIIHTLSTEYGVSDNRLVAAMRDRVAANGVAMRTIKIIFPDVLDIGCYAHTLDHVGDHFNTPQLEEFMHLWINLFSHSPRTQMEWKNDTGRAMASYSSTRWWSKWEVYHQVLVQFGDILPFLEKHCEIAPKARTSTKLLEILKDNKKKSFLQIELAAIIDVGESFVKATYNLEGDGPLVLLCYDQIQLLKAKIENPLYPNVEALARTLSTRGRTYQQLKQHAINCVQPGLDYFISKFFGNSAPLTESLAAFKAARLFVPHRLVEMEANIILVDSLTAFPFLNKQSIIESLKTELPAYLSLAKDVAPTIDPLKWWDGHQNDLPNWSKALEDVLLVQPTSAASERVFSMLKQSFGPQQDHSLHDYIEASLLLQFNQR